MYLYCKNEEKNIRELKVQLVSYEISWSKEADRYEEKLPETFQCEDINGNIYYLIDLLEQYDRGWIETSDHPFGAKYDLFLPDIRTWKEMLQFAQEESRREKEYWQEFHKRREQQNQKWWKKLFKI